MSLARRLAGVAAAMALALPGVANAACLNHKEAENITLVALPEILRETGLVCAAKLPSTSLLKQANSPFLARYDAAADSAWPQARAAIVKLSNPAANALLGSAYARPLLTSLIVPLLVGRIAPADCGTIDTLVTQLAPLPPRNTASVVVTALTYLNGEKAKGKPIDVPELPLCRENAR